MVDAALDRVLPPESAPPPNIHRAMRYSVLAPGKRLPGPRRWAGAPTPCSTPPVPSS